MLEIALGSALIYYAAKEAFDIKEQPAETVRYTETLDSRQDSFVRMHREPVRIKPALQDQFRGIVRQAYDYSCGSAALTTLLNGYVGTQLDEQQVMNGLMQFGETDKIVERRSFSLLDMKRFVAALGLESGAIEENLKTWSNKGSRLLFLFLMQDLNILLSIKHIKTGVFILLIQHSAILVLMNNVLNRSGKIIRCI